MQPESGAVVLLDNKMTPAEEGNNLILCVGVILYSCLYEGQFKFLICMESTVLESDDTLVCCHFCRCQYGLESQRNNFGILRKKAYPFSCQELDKKINITFMFVC